MPRITELYAWVTTDTGDDDEGVPAFYDAGGKLMPMMGAEMARANQLRPMAEAMAKRFGKRMRLVRSTALEEVEVISPDPGGEEKRDGRARDVQENAAGEALVDAREGDDITAG